PYARHRPVEVGTALSVTPEKCVWQARWPPLGRCGLFRAFFCRSHRLVDVVRQKPCASRSRCLEHTAAGSAGWLGRVGKSDDQRGDRHHQPATAEPDALSPVSGNDTTPTAFAAGADIVGASWRPP